MPKPRMFKASATAILRGLRWLEPLPWAKIINPSGLFGMFSVPERLSGGSATANDSDDVTLMVTAYPGYSSSCRADFRAATLSAPAADGS